MSVFLDPEMERLQCSKLYGLPAWAPDRKSLQIRLPRPAQTLVCKLPLCGAHPPLPNAPDEEKRHTSPSPGNPSHAYATAGSEGAERHN